MPDGVRWLGKAPKLYVYTVGRSFPIAHSLNPLASLICTRIGVLFQRRVGGGRGVGNPVLGVIHAFKARGRDFSTSLVRSGAGYRPGRAGRACELVSGVLGVDDSRARSTSRVGEPRSGLLAGRGLRGLSHLKQVLRDP
jgi:hypothetical protein